MFDRKKEKDNVVKFIREYFEKNNLGGVVIGISGGKDSAVVAALFAEAIGPERILGVTLPCHSLATDKSDAEIIADFYNFRLINLDLTKTYDSFKEEVYKLGDFTDEELLNSDINIKPRLRMSSLYYLAALESALKGKTYVVAGTSNKCEEFVGYFTKGGDNVCDIKTIADFTVEQVLAIGEELNVPHNILYKTPSDGLSGKSDEDKLGVTYKAITNYMEGKEVSEKDRKTIERLHKNTHHKFNIPTYRREEN